MRMYLEESKEIWGEEEIEKLSGKELDLLLDNFNLFASFEPKHIKAALSKELDRLEGVKAAILMHKAPLPGDYIIIHDKVEQIAKIGLVDGCTYKLQPLRYGSLYADAGNYRSISGTFGDPLTAELSDTGTLKDAKFWTFYEGEPGSYRGIWLTGRFRVWRKINS